MAAIEFLQQELENIRADIVSGTYKTQYAFEEQIQVLISRIHDSHVTLDAGMLAAFKFASPYTLLSLSENGSEEPKIYLKEDLLAAAKEGYDASPVTKINGIEVIEYLTSLIAPNSEGYVEPHADWNSLLSSPAKDIQGYLSIFQRLPLYPGMTLLHLHGGLRITTYLLKSTKLHRTLSQALTAQPLQVRR